jgi:glutathione S-transferase
VSVIFQCTVLFEAAQKIPTEMREKLVSALNALESFLLANKWFAGNNITIADFSILPSITTVKV